MKERLRNVLWCLLGAVLIIAAIVFVAREEHHAAIEYQRACYEHPPSAGPAPSEQKRSSADKCQDPKEYMPWWYVLIAWPEGIATWALILTLGAIVAQAVISGKAATAALRQTQYMAATSRAWVMDTEVQLTAGAKDRPEGSEQVFIHCNAKNHGPTVARVLGMNAILVAGPISDPGKTWDKKLYWFPNKTTPQWMILPDTNSALHCAVPGISGQPGQILKAPIKAGETSFIHGVIKYWDVFSETPRFTRFCYRYEEPADWKPGFYRAGGNGYNHQT